jgi:hypothetical protein
MSLYLGGRIDDGREALARLYNTYNVTVLFPSLYPTENTQSYQTFTQRTGGTAVKAMCKYCASGFGCDPNAYYERFILKLLGQVYFFEFYPFNVLAAMCCDYMQREIKR